jgi:hypothetical protein
MSTIDAAREINPKEFRIATFVSIWIVGGLKRDAINGTSHRAEIAGHAPLFSVGISGQDDSSTPAWRQIGSFLWILNRDRLRECPFEDNPETQQ